MDRYEAVMKLLLDCVEKENKTLDDYNVPVGVSNRHIHLSKKDLDILFGNNYELTKMKDLSQPGQYACKEVLIICGPKGAIDKVRILGPLRNKTQVEVLNGDAYKLGISLQARNSGDLKETSGITLVGPKGTVQIDEGVIVAKRHIHMSSKDARDFGLIDGQEVSIEFNGSRGGIYKNVTIRANDSSALECHIDIEEANAMMIKGSSKVKIIK